VRGERSQYQPIHQQSILTASSDIEAVIKGFLTVSAFKCFYIADLNAICGYENHAELIDHVLQRYPEFDFWVDTGCKLAELEKNTRPNNYKTVLGTESQAGPPQAIAQAYILSLDYQQQALGDTDWFTQSQFWPKEVIVMSLSRVGSQTGPDFAKLANLLQQYPEQHWIAAGGVRNGEDLSCLAHMGVAGVLLATALHQGSITETQLKHCNDK
jgi:phosphoribosylformimino-5-aminoimidazole carboxamide ribotide isomerase